MKDGSSRRVTSVPKILLEKKGKMMISYHLYLARIKEKYKKHSAFISSFLNSKMGQALIRKYISGSVSPTIRDDDLKNIKIPIPKDETISKEIQKEINDLQRSILLSTDFPLPSKDIENQMGFSNSLPTLPINWYPGKSTKYNYTAKK